MFPGEDFMMVIEMPFENFRQAIMGKYNYDPKEKTWNPPLKNSFRLVKPKQRIEVLDRQQWLCNSCGCKLKVSKMQPGKEEVAHIDHIHSFADRETYSKGKEFINETENLQALCKTCNMMKHKRKS